MEVQLYAFLTSALNGDGRPASRNFHFTPYTTKQIGGEVGLKGELDEVKNNSTFVPASVQALFLVLPASMF
jgi:hypothetical protein